MLVSAVVLIVMGCCCCLSAVVGVGLVADVDIFGIAGTAGTAGIVVGIVLVLVFVVGMLIQILIAVVSCFGETERPPPLSDVAGIVAAGWNKTRHKNWYS